MVLLGADCRTACVGLGGVLSLGSRLCSVAVGRVGSRKVALAVLVVGLFCFRFARRFRFGSVYVKYMAMAS